MPGRRSMMRYCPLPSVIAVRTFSMSAGLEASTVTPGRTAPDRSLATPVIDCARPTAGQARKRRTNPTQPHLIFMSSLLLRGALAGPRLATCHGHAYACGPHTWTDADDADIKTSTYGRSRLSVRSWSV